MFPKYDINVEYNHRSKGSSFLWVSLTSHILTSKTENCHLVIL